MLSVTRYHVVLYSQLDLSYERTFTMDVEHNSDTGQYVAFNPLLGASEPRYNLSSAILNLANRYKLTFRSCKQVAL